jgi:hypothetical protein
MKDKTLFNDPNLSLMQTGGWYTYAHMSRTEKGQLVAVLVYKKDDQGKVTHLLGRYENTLPHKDGIGLSSITGGVDKGTWHLPTVREELIQEAGVPDQEILEDIQRGMEDKEGMQRLEYLGTCRPSKQEDTLCHLYTFDATGLELQQSITDGTQGEQGSYCKWEEPYLVLGCKCPLVACIAVRSGIIQRIR